MFLFNLTIVKIVNTSRGPRPVLDQKLLQQWADERKNAPMSEASTAAAAATAGMAGFKDASREGGG